MTEMTGIWPKPGKPPGRGCPGGTDPDDGALGRLPALPGDATSARLYPWVMQQWEYMQTIIPGNVATKSNLDEMGAQGWELVSVFMRYLSGWETLFYFKRPVEPRAKK